MLIYDSFAHFLAVNHLNNEDWVPSILTHNLWLNVMGMKQKRKKRIQNWGLKQNFSTPLILNIFLQKRHGFILEVHWCGSTYMALRLSDICSKTGKRSIFWVSNFDFFLIFFYFIPIKISQKLCVRMDGTQLLLSRWFTAKKWAQES